MPWTPAAAKLVAERLMPPVPAAMSRLPNTVKPVPVPTPVLNTTEPAPVADCVTLRLVLPTSAACWMMMLPVWAALPTAIVPAVIAASSLLLMVMPPSAKPRPMVVAAFAGAKFKVPPPTLTMLVPDAIETSLATSVIVAPPLAIALADEDRTLIAEPVSGFEVRVMAPLLVLILPPIGTLIAPPVLVTVTAPPTALFCALKLAA